MAFDSAVYPNSAPVPQMPTAQLIDVAGDLCPMWTAQNPDRALALLFVAPRDCMAVDILASL